ncbi:MAG TPA: hypothetical protein VJT31_23990, partial [Rugosimonospora sp.]|nr:hypothetical protein [Rugosimonospora sp.]
MRRRNVVAGLAVAGFLPAVAACTSRGSETSSGSSGSTSLVFDKSRYTTATKTVATGSGSRSVTYHRYSAITYCANPVDATYQSLNVSVPVSIDGKAVDATNAPILLDLNIGGYM